MRFAHMVPLPLPFARRSRASPNEAKTMTLGGRCILSFMLLQEPLYPHQSFLQFVIRGTIGGAHIACASRAKGVAGDDRDLLFKEQLLRKLLFAHAGIANMGEGVESSSWFATGQTQAIKPRDKHLATARIFIVHRLHVGFAMTQRFQRRLLSCCTGAHDRILVNFEHSL